MTTTENKPTTLRAWLDWGLTYDHFTQELYDEIMSNTQPNRDASPCSSLSDALQAAFLWDCETEETFEYWESIWIKLRNQGL